MNEYNYVGFPFWIFGWAIFMLIFFTLVLRNRWWGQNRPNNWQGDNAKDPLTYAKTRYAKGEITKEELDVIKRNLKD